jgi:hypothetical protein
MSHRARKPWKWSAPSWHVHLPRRVLPAYCLSRCAAQTPRPELLMRILHQVQRFVTWIAEWHSPTPGAVVGRMNTTSVALPASLGLKAGALFNDTQGLVRSHISSLSEGRRSLQRQTGARQIAYLLEHLHPISYLATTKHASIALSIHVYALYEYVWQRHKKPIRSVHRSLFDRLRTVVSR